MHGVAVSDWAVILVGWVGEHGTPLNYVRGEDARWRWKKLVHAACVLSVRHVSCQKAIQGDSLAMPL